MATVEFVLKTLQEHVVCNTAINKSSKIRVFNEKALRQISRLYQWSGSSRHKSNGHVSHGQQQLPIIEADTELTEDQLAVRSLVHSFLLELCCSFKNGINFFDRSFGTSGKPMNNILGGFLSSLRHADSLQAELIVAVLRTCPDLLHSYLPCMQNSLAPRLSIPWLNACHFFIQIYHAQPDVCAMWKLQEKHNVDKLVAMATRILIPPRDLWSLVVSAVKHKSSLVRHKGLQMLLLVLTKAQSSVEYCQQPDKVNAGEQKWRQCVLAFRDTLAKMLPSVDHVYNCWTQSDEVTNEKTDATPTPELQAPNELDRLTTVLKVLCSYNDILATLTLPAAHLVSMLDRIQAVSKVQSPEDDRSLLTGLRLQMMRLLSVCDGRQIAWSKQSSGGHSVTYLLLEMVLSTAEDTELNKSIKQLLVKLLVSTSMFERCESEIMIWLDCVSNADLVQSNAAHTILSFVEKSIVNALHDPYEYAEQIRHLVSEALTKHGDTGAVPFDIDALMAMDDTVLESSDSLTEDDDDDIIGECLPFSILLVVAVESLATVHKIDTAVSRFTHELLLRVLWLQDDPLPLCLLIKRHLVPLRDTTCELTDRLRKTFSRWLPELKAKDTKSPHKQPDFTQEADISTYLQHCFETTDTSAHKQHLLSRLRDDHSSEETSLFLIRQILLYLSSEIATEETKTEISLSEVQTYFDLLAVFTESADASRSTFHLVLRCSTLQRHFLSCDSEVSQLVTERLCGIVSSIPSSLHLALGALRPYSERIETCLMVGELSPEVLDSFLPRLEVKMSGRLCEWLAQQPLGALVSGTDLTPHGHAFVLIATHMSDWPTIALSDATISRLLAMAPIAQNAKLDALLLSALKRQPSLMECVTIENFLALLNTGRETQLRIVSVCVTAGATYWQWFASWCESHVEEMKSDWTRYLHVVLHWLVSGWHTGLLTDTECSSHLAWLSDFYYSQLSQTTPEQGDTKKEEEVGEDIPLDDHYRLLCVLAKLRLNNDNAPEMSQTASVQLQASGLPCLSQFKYYHYLLDCLPQGSAHDSFREQFVIDCMHALLALLQKRTPTHLVTENYIIKSALKAIQSVNQLSDTFVTSIADIWDKFMKMGLRHHYQTGTFLDWLRLTASAIYHANVEAARIGDLHEMLTSHSKFLSSLLQDRDNSKDGTDHTVDAVKAESKVALLKLLLALLRLEPSYCNKAHLPLLFAAYGVTLHQNDQLILCLLHHHESNGHSLKEYRPYVWGSRALEQYALKKDLGPSLLKQPTMQEVVELFKPDVLRKSSVLFPLKRRLQDVGEYRGMPADEMMSSEICYDPCFLLPLFTHLLAPASLVSCEKFVETGCLGYLMSCLSSEDRSVRGAACHCLHLFSQHLEAAHNYVHYDQVAYLLECVQNSLDKAGVRLACIISVFLVRACQLISVPDDPLYQPVNAFLLLKPKMDIQNIPEFYKLFNSATLQLKTERSWMLTLLADGLRRHEDYRIFERRYAFKLLLCFHDSPTSDSQSRKQVLGVLLKACRIRSVCRDLTNNHALLAWICSAIVNRHADEANILAELLLSIWDALVQSDVKQKGDNGEQNAAQLLADDMILVILVLLRNSRNSSDKHSLFSDNNPYIKAADNSVKSMLHGRREMATKSRNCDNFCDSTRSNIENTLYGRVSSYITAEGNEKSNVQRLFISELVSSKGK